MANLFAAEQPADVTQQTEVNLLICEKCAAVVSAPPGCTVGVTFTCRNCAATVEASVGENPLAFDRYQFEKPRRSPKFVAALRERGVEFRGHIWPDSRIGFQEIPPPVPRHNTPAWAFNDRFLLRLCARYAAGGLRSAAVRFTALYRYHRLGWDARDVAGSLSVPMTAESVECLLKRLAVRADIEWPKFLKAGESGRDGLRAVGQSLCASAHRPSKGAGSPGRFPRASTLGLPQMQALAEGDRDTVELVREFGRMNPIMDLIGKVVEEPAPRDRNGFPPYQEPVITSFGDQRTSKPNHGRHREPMLSGAEYRSTADWRARFTESGWATDNGLGDGDPCAEAA